MKMTGFMALALLLFFTLLAISTSSAEVDSAASGSKLVDLLRSKRQDSAAFCKWLGSHIGWYCDDPVSRWIWKKVQWLRGVTDCNSFCVKAGKRGGACRSNVNYDVSTWCPRGQTCICN